MFCHEIDYQILGSDMQIIEVELDPGETVIAEAGAMNYMEDDIDFESRMGDGSEPDQGIMGKLLGAGKRMLTGESMFFGGEGLFLATLRGHGTVLLQSLPFSRLADRVLAHAPSAGGSRKGEGSVLGGIANLFEE